MRKTAKIVIRISSLAAIAILIGVVFLAYGYTPAEESGRSSYLQEERPQSIETRSYRFNSIRTGTGTPIVLIHGAGT